MPTAPESPHRKLLEAFELMTEVQKRRQRALAVLQAAEDDSSDARALRAQSAQARQQSVQNRRESDESRHHAALLMREARELVAQAERLVAEATAAGSARTSASD